MGQKLTLKTIFNEEVKFGLQIVLNFATEDSRTLLDHFGDVGILKMVRFKESDYSLRVLEVIFIDLELLGN